MAKKIVKQPQIISGKITTTPIDRDAQICFSFRHLDLQHDKFGIQNKSALYFIRVLERFKDLSSMRLYEFLQNRSQALRIHSIDWSKTSEPNGFSHLNQQLREETAYQFQISANEHGRIHGFLLDKTFFVVWLDPDHRLYS